MVRRGHAIEAWLNGERMMEQVQKPTSQATVSGPENLFVGKVISNRGANNLFRGMLDDVRIYECALSVKEIQELIEMRDAE